MEGQPQYTIPQSTSSTEFHIIYTVGIYPSHGKRLSSTKNKLRVSSGMIGLLITVILGLIVSGVPTGSTGFRTEIAPNGQETKVKSFSNFHSVDPMLVHPVVRNICCCADDQISDQDIEQEIK